MPKYIQHRERIEHHEYRLSFRYEDPAMRGSGFSFPCDEHGEVNFDGLPDPAQSNYICCAIVGSIELSNVYRGDFKRYKLVKEGVVRYDMSYTQPAIIECSSCGEPVYLDGYMTNECEHCGHLYNMSGQSLAPRSQWGWDTGEHPADIERPLTDHEEQFGVDY